MNKRFYSAGVACLALMASLAALPAMAATLPGSSTFGNLNQPWGTRRPVSAADHAMVERFRSGHGSAIYTTRFQDAGALAAD